MHRYVGLEHHDIYHSACWFKAIQPPHHGAFPRESLRKENKIWTLQFVRYTSSSQSAVALFSCQVYEETGFDIRQLVSQESYIEVTQNDHTSRMYIIPGVPDNTHFEPKARKEIKVSLYCILCHGGSVLAARDVSRCSTF